MYNWETVAQAEDWLQVFVLREAGIAERSGYRVPPEPLDYLIRWAYERQQVSKRGVSLSQRIYETVDELSHRLIEGINPLVDEIQEVHAYWDDCRKDAVWTLSVPDSVIGRLNVSWDVEEQRKMAAEEAADDGGHN